MTDDTRSILRGFGVLGAAFLIIATFLPWFSYEVLVPTGRVATILDVNVGLWNVSTLAAVLLVVGGVVALLMLTMVTSRAAGLITALVGLGTIVYTAIRCFDIPDLGLNRATDIAPAAHAATTLEGGIFVAMSGGILLLIGSAGDLFGAADEEDTVAVTGPEAIAGRPRIRQRRGVRLPGRGVRH